MKPPAEALEIFLGRLGRKNSPGSEQIRTVKSFDRVTSGPVYAKLSSPSFHTAAMDGFAVDASFTFGAAPDTALGFVIGESAWPVNTGRPIPAGTNAVIMIEHVNFVNDETFEIEKALVPWENVRRVGEDFVQSEMILPSRRIISAYDIGALLCGGVTKIRVVRKPRVLLIPTGSELVSAKQLENQPPDFGQSIEFNTHILAELVAQAGGVPVRADIVPDDYALIRKAVISGVESGNDIVVVNAGSSAGSEDYTASIIAELGEILVHGVAMMPGKPTILGIVKGKPVIGTPGYPVSAVFSFEIFGLPVISWMLRIPGYNKPTTYAFSARKVPSKLGREEFFRVKLGKVGGRIVAAPLPRGAGSITTLTRADGIIKIPLNSEGIEQGSMVEVDLLNQPQQIENTLVIIGSNDLTIDCLADELAKHGVYVSSSNVGSLSGLLALKNDTAHVATSHLLDEDTGIYNWAYIKKFIPDVPVGVFHGVMREQGFMVNTGNPKNILRFHDLTRNDVTFVNRQKGAGTRVLLDYYLNKIGIDASDIKGYETEEYTHTSVAVSVLSGVADVGMGVLAAANALGLDFIPLATEQYDFIVPQKYLEDEKIIKLLEIIGSQSFRTRIASLGGYGVERSGERLLEPK
ncbi:MAG: molybdopterin biosynthesis protein [Desulfomonilaceae bacterium]